MIIDLFLSVFFSCWSEMGVRGFALLAFILKVWHYAFDPDKYNKDDGQIFNTCGILIAIKGLGWQTSKYYCK